MPSTYETNANDGEAMNTGSDVEEGEVGPNEIVWNKVYLYGAGDLAWEDILMFANDNYNSKELTKKDLEWVDDDAVKLVYPSSDHAAAALKAFSVENAEDPLQLRTAQKLIIQPGTDLQIRMATVQDIKKKGAAAESRFYLRNPEYGPASERPRPRRMEGRGRPRDYDDDVDRPRKARRVRRDEGFSVDLYDDAPEAQDRLRARRASEQSEHDYITGRARTLERSGDLFKGRDEGRLRRSRDRSASPRREGAGYYGFSDDQPYRQTARARTPPPRSHSDRVNQGMRKDMKKDLFAGKQIGTALTNGDVNGRPAPRELFPGQKPKDLFEDKLNHRRQDAKDLHPDEVATAIGNFDFTNNMHTTNTYNESGRRPENAPRDLFARIEGGPKLAVNSAAGRLTERPASAGNAEGFSIRGAGQNNPISFKIKGMGKKEDLFAHKMTGRGNQRRLAEDIE